MIKQHAGFVRQIWKKVTNTNVSDSLITWIPCLKSSVNSTSGVMPNFCFSAPASFTLASRTDLSVAISSSSWKYNNFVSSLPPMMNDEALVLLIRTVSKSINRHNYFKTIFMAICLSLNCHFNNGHKQQKCKFPDLTLHQILRSFSTHCKCDHLLKWLLITSNYYRLSAKKIKAATAVYNQSITKLENNKHNI